MKYKVFSVMSIILAISTCMGPTPSESGDSEWVIIEPSGSSVGSLGGLPEWVRPPRLSDTSEFPESIGPPPGLDHPISLIENNNVKLDNYIQQALQFIEIFMTKVIHEHNDDRHPNMSKYEHICRKMSEIPTFPTELIMDKFAEIDAAFQEKMKSLGARCMPRKITECLFDEKIESLGHQINRLEGRTNKLPEICQAMSETLLLCDEKMILELTRGRLSSILKGQRYNLICEEVQVVGVREAIKNALEFTKQEYLESKKFATSIRVLIVLYNSNFATTKIKSNLRLKKADIEKDNVQNNIQGSIMQPASCT